MVLALIVLLLLFLLKQFYHMSRSDTLTEYFLDIWNYMDIIIVIIGYVCILLFFQRNEVANRIISFLNTHNHNEYVSFTDAIYWDEMINAMAALLVCLSTIRLWKFLRFGFYFRIFENTIFRNCSAYLYILFGII